MNTSYRFVFLLFIIVASSAAPGAVEPKAGNVKVQPLTVEALDSYIGLMSMFKDMLPKDLMGTLTGLNMTQKGELVSFITDWFQDKISKPTTKDGIVDLLKNHLPSVYDKISGLNTTFYEKFNALQPETQNLLREWRDKAVDLTSDRPAGESAAQQLQLLRDFAMSVQNMDDTTRNDLRQQFPAAVSLTEGLGFTVFTTMAMVLQKILETVTPQAQPTMAAGTECAIPLDRRF